MRKDDKSPNFFGMFIYLLPIIGLMMLYSSRSLPLDTAPFFTKALKWSVSLYIAMIVISYFPHYRLTSYLVLIIWFPIWYAGTVGVMTFINSNYDSSEPIHASNVINERGVGYDSIRSRLMGQYGNYVVVPSWRVKNGTEKIRIPSRVNHEIIMRQTSLSYVIRKGYLGYSWIEAPEVGDYEYSDSISVN